jgi:carbamoyl-phosphate synthase large subunit
MMKIGRVFVSGGAGVIGREMIPKLVARGATVMVGDLKPRPADFPADVHYRQGDLNTLTEGELAAFAPDCFIHLAATFERSTETYGFWEENFWHNVRLSHHLMTVAKDLPSLKRVVFASSYLIYDQALYQFAAPQTAARALNENDPILPRNLTGMAKLAHEIELRFLDGFRSEVFTTACARIYRGYGCNSRDVISRWIRALLRGEPVTVYRPEGLFDYIYAKDTAEGLVRLALSNVTGIINLGTGRARRVQDVVDVLRRHFPAMKAETADSDIPFEASQAGTTAWHKAIGWLPEYDLEQAIPEMIAFERARPVDAVATYGNVLISSAARKVPLVRAVQDAARKLNPAIKVIAGDLNAAAATRHVADEFWQMPPTNEASVDAIIAGCRKHGVSVVIPTRDSELAFWARLRERLALDGIAIIVSPAQSVTACFDKLAFAAFGAAQGLPFIPAAETPDGPGPYVVKERFGAGSRGIGLNLPREAALAHAATLKAPIYQPFVRGQEISIDAWLDRHHRVKGLVLRRRDHVVDGESQITTTFHDAKLEAEAVRVLEALTLSGPVVLQGFCDGSGQLRVIECNPRFGGASTTAIAAGLDIFYWTLLEAAGGDVGSLPFDRIPGEVRQIRVPSDIHVHGPGF